MPGSAGEQKGECKTVIYKDFQGMKLSALSMGAMRLPVIGGENSRIDQEATQRMVDYAMEHGVNYFDTAWGYHDGNSELAMGQALSRHPRESFCLASKFPGYDLSNMDKVEEIFCRQLEKCRVDYFDFYLIHNVCELNVEAYLDPKYGIYEYLTAQKRAGRIRHLGFSVHGSYEVMQRFLERYGDVMEFCQIQLNYLDWDFQDAKAKVERLNQLGIPIWVMEPLRGGRLANLSEEDAAELRRLRPEESVPAWGFRFLQTVPGVTMILSGMSSLEQMAENIRIFSEEKPLDREEWDAVMALSRRMLSRKTQPCTACRYCTTHCPMQLDIPDLIALYNELSFSGMGFRVPMVVSTLPEEKRPSACIGCRSCEVVCPQQIKISEVFADFVQQLSR